MHHALETNYRQVTVSIAQELTTARKPILNHTNKADYNKKKENTTQVNAKKPYGPKFHLQISAELQQNHPFWSRWLLLLVKNGWLVVKQREAKTVIVP